jgi:CRISPR/Cas system CMR subunit Cmr4 (Cas7 group RAMP superfamily)
MAEERLKNAARLTIDRIDASAGTVTIVVANTGAGHKLPTGLTDTRQMWLEVVVKNNRVATLYTTGKAGTDGYLPEGTILYNTVFGNGKGKAVNNVSQAREILKDRRIPPFRSLTETIKLPKLTTGAITVEVRLLYRIADQRTVDAVFGKETFKLPVVEMAAVKKKIEVK